MLTKADDGELELRDYLDVLRRRKWIIVATTALVTVSASLASLSQTKVYSATAEVLLQNRASERIFSPDGQQSAGGSGVETEIQVMKSRSVQDAVATVLGRAAAVSIEAIGDTDVVAIRSEDTRPTEAQKVANTYAEVYIAQRRAAQIADLLDAATEVQVKIDEIDKALLAIAGDQVGDAEIAQRQTLLTQRATYSQQLSQLQLAGALTESGGAQLVSEADVPGVPIRPTPRRTASFALIVGAFLGIGLAILRDYLDDSLRTKDQIESTTGLSMLASIPAVPGWRRGDPPRLVSLTDPTSASAEAYRALRTSLQFLSLERALETVQVTSAEAGDGKTTTVANLAVSLARAGQRVVIVDCDLRRPRLHEFFGLDNRVGLTSALVGEVTLENALQRVPGEERLRVVASGPLPPNPSELLSSKRTAALFDDLRELADVVVIDSPPILPVTDGVILAGLVDATVVVGTVGRATRRSLHRAVETLRRVGAPLVGVVLNGSDQTSRYGYHYGYGDDRPAGAKRRLPGRSSGASERRKVRA